MTEATSWHFKMFPAAKPVTELEICALAAGRSALLGSASRTPEPQHPKEIAWGHLGEQAVPEQMAGHSAEWKEAGVDGGVLNTIATPRVRPLIILVQGAGAQRPPGAGSVAVWQAVPCHRHLLQADNGLPADQAAALPRKRQMLSHLKI